MHEDRLNNEKQSTKQSTERSITCAQLAVMVVRVTSVLIPRVEGDVKEALIELQNIALDYLEYATRRRSKGWRRNWRLKL